MGKSLTRFTLLIGRSLDMVPNVFREHFHTIFKNKVFLVYKLQCSFQTLGEKWARVFRGQSLFWTNCPFKSCPGLYLQRELGEPIEILRCGIKRINPQRRSVRADCTLEKIEVGVLLYPLSVLCSWSSFCSTDFWCSSSRNIPSRISPE